MYTPRNLRYLRLKANLTAKEVASSVNATPEELLRFEDGERTITAEQGQRLADFFGVSLEVLVFRCMPNVPSPDGYDLRKGFWTSQT